jgi:large subunit ribosomal protein L14
MISHRSILTVTDNSGVRYVKCLKVVKTISAYGKKQLAGVGDVILVSVKITRPVEKIKKGHVLRGLIVRTKKNIKRIYGSLNFNENSIILLNKKNEPIGNRIFGPISKEAFEQNFVKFSTVHILDI